MCPVVSCFSTSVVTLFYCLHFPAALPGVYTFQLRFQWHRLPGCHHISLSFFSPFLNTLSHFVGLFIYIPELAPVYNFRFCTFRLARPCPHRYFKYRTVASHVVSRVGQLHSHYVVGECQIWRSIHANAGTCSRRNQWAGHECRVSLLRVRSEVVVFRVFDSVFSCAMWSIEIASDHLEVLEWCPLACDITAGLHSQMCYRNRCSCTLIVCSRRELCRTNSFRRVH